MKRKLLVAAVLLFLGTLAYLLLSRGPSRVHVVTVPLQVCFLASLSIVAWVPKISLLKRILALLGIVLVFSVIGTYLDSLVVRVFYPLHPVQFLIGFVAFLIEAVVFLCATWVVDLGVNAASRKGVISSRTERR